MRARTSTDPPPNGLAFAAARSCVDGRVVVRRADERRSVPGPADRERRSTGESAQSAVIQDDDLRSTREMRETAV